MRVLAIVRELSLRPYHGRLFVVKTAKAYEKAHKKLFKTPDVLTCAQEGRFSGGEGNDGMWTYLIWGKGTAHAGARDGACGSASVRAMRIDFARGRWRAVLLHAFSATAGGWIMMANGAHEPTANNKQGD